jgi:hypothetical protein
MGLHLYNSLALSEFVMRYLFASFAFLLCGTMLFAAEDPALEAAKGQYDKSISKLDQDLEAAKKKHADGAAAAKEKLLAAYDAAIKRTTQKGELEAANLLVAAKKALAQGEGAEAAVPAVAGPAAVEPGEGVSPAKVDPKKWYLGYLGYYFRSGDPKTVHPYINLSIPNQDVWTEAIQAKMRGKIDFSGITYEGQSMLVIPKDGTYVLQFHARNHTHLDGKMISPGEVELKKGTYRIKSLGYNEFLGATQMKVTSKATGEPVPLVIKGADIRAFLSQRINGVPVQEVSGQGLVEVKVD